MCMSNVADKSNVVSSFGRSVLLHGYAVVSAGGNEKLTVCRSPGFGNDSLMMSVNVIMCYKYAAP